MVIPDNSANQALPRELLVRRDQAKLDFGLAITLGLSAALALTPWLVKDYFGNMPGRFYNDGPLVAHPAQGYFLWGSLCLTVIFPVISIALAIGYSRFSRPVKSWLCVGLATLQLAAGLFGLLILLALSD